MKCFPLLMAAMLPLAAQESSIGARVHGMVPMSDLRDLTNGQIGVGIAGFVSIPVSQGLVLRPLVGVQYIPKGESTFQLTGTKTSVTSVDLMVDALWYPDDDPDKGAYLVASMGGQQWRVSSTGAAPSTISATRLGLGGGLGYQFSPRFSVEARGFWSPINKDLTATGLTLGATLRF